MSYFLVRRLQAHLMSRMVLTFLFAALVTVRGADHLPTVTLSAAVASTGRTGNAALSEGYRGKLHIVARTGVAANLRQGNQAETVEFTHIHYDDRGVGARCKPALAIVVANPAGYRFPAIYIKEIPSINRLKEFTRIEDFEHVFGQFRSITDAWCNLGGDMHGST